MYSAENVRGESQKLQHHNELARFNQLAPRKKILYSNVACLMQYLGPRPLIIPHTSRPGYLRRKSVINLIGTFGVSLEDLHVTERCNDSHWLWMDGKLALLARFFWKIQRRTELTHKSSSPHYSLQNHEVYLCVCGRVLRYCRRQRQRAVWRACSGRCPCREAARGDQGGRDGCCRQGQGCSRRPHWLPDQGAQGQAPARWSVCRLVCLQRRV